MVLIKLRTSLLVVESFFSTALIFSVYFSSCHNTPRTFSIGILCRPRFMSVDFTVFVDDKDFKMSWLFEKNFVKLNPPFDNNCLAFVGTFIAYSFFENRSRLSSK